LTHVVQIAAVKPRFSLARGVQIVVAAITCCLLILLPRVAAAAACEGIAVPRDDVVHGRAGARADEFLQAAADEGLSGAVLVSRRGEILLKKGYGYANRETREPNSSETLFNIASVSKIFTAAAILDLEAHAKLSLDDTLDAYLGSFPDEKRTATVHHLLTHTAGLVVRGFDLDYDSREGFVESVERAPIESKPGEVYRYTNAGYILLAAIVEKVSGQRFDDYLADRIFKPACLERTAFAWDKRIRGMPTAVGYAGDSVTQLFAEPPEEDVWGNRGPSNIATNVGDLYRWMRALGGGKILPETSIRKMFTAYVGDEGYGWHVGDSEYGRLLRRGGGLPGFESSLRWYPDDDVLIIVLMNNHLGFRVPVVTGIEKVVFAGHSPGD